MIMLIELVAIIVSMFLMALLFQGGAGSLKFLTMFLDLPSLICILLLSLPILVKNGLFKDFIRAFKMQSKKFSCSLSDMRRSLDVVELMQKQILYAGGIATIVPVIYVLCIVDDLALVGPNIAVSLMTVFYTAILELLLLPMQLEIKRRIIDYMEEE